MDINSNEPLSDQWRRQAHVANDFDAAATLLERTRSAVLSQMKTKLIAIDNKIANNKAEDIAKSSPEWKDFNDKMVAARQRANAAKIDAEWMHMKYFEDVGHRADERTIARF